MGTSQFTKKIPGTDGPEPALTPPDLDAAATAFLKKPKLGSGKTRKRDMPEGLWTKCPKCEELAGNAKAAVKELGLEAEVSKVTDIVEIANRGVMLTPALSVDGDVKLVGKVATVEELKAIFTSR